ncbi:hypothetical protein GCM10010449_11980 [Streptomyces rectiviolaceus]|uniref:Uncharacterized protein n=1 Tax=Streptomyces rectiviolaceus TaxID=332591 RepID=A0ABP6MDU8_9ACTN
MTRPECRTARVAVRGPLTARAMRTWKAITARVLRTKSADTSQLGAFVRSTTQSGIARLSSGIRSSRTALSAVMTAYGRSRSTARRGSSFPRATDRGTEGSLSSTSAQSRKPTASSAKTAR